jgi:Cof subfamily protein (haloacid dehalogenase superfamily)
MDKIKLIALDVDGTLVNDEHRLTERVRDAVAAAFASGVMVALCTGRGPANTLPVFEKLGISGYMLSHNGGVTCHSAPYRVLESSSFAVAAVRPVIEYCRKHNVHFDLCSVDHLYCETMGEYEQQMYQHFLIDPVLMDDVMTLAEPIVKLTLFGEQAQMDGIERDCAAIAHGLNMIRSDARFIDFMVPDISKGASLARLCARYGIARSEVLAIGNYYNDREMIAFAGVGIAVANAPEDLKALADDVTTSNNDDGVYYALKKYVL